jgi:hypothetical protein
MANSKQAEAVLGWWFCREERVLPHGDGRPVVAGEILTVPGPVILCKRGLHASERPMDALSYAPGPILCRVRLSGEIVRGEDKGDDKLAATERTVLWMADASATLWAFACDCAERALTAERAAGREPAAASWAAVETRRRWLRGEATDADLSAASSAASSAAWSAASKAADSAASSAASSAAWSAASKAASSAASRAAYWAADGAEREWQNTNLARLFLALAPPDPRDERTASNA